MSCNTDGDQLNQQVETRAMLIAICRQMWCTLELKEANDTDGSLYKTLNRNPMR